MWYSTKAWGTAPGHPPGPAEPDAVELVAEHGAVDGDDLEGRFELQAADVHRATQHVGREAGTLLVGEEADGEGASGFDAPVDDRLDDLQTGEHAEVAVVAPAGADRVDVRSGEHGAGRGVRAEHADHVADAVDGHVQAEIAHPGDDELAPDPVFVGECQTGASLGARDGTDRGELGEASLETGSADVDGVERIAHTEPPSRSAARTRSGVSGNSSNQTPVASCSAATTAAA